MHGPRTSGGGATRFTLVTTACAALLILLGALTARYVFVELPAEIAQRTTRDAIESARKIAAEVAGALQVRPKVIVGRKTVVEQQNAVLQLVTLEKTLTERQRLDESWLHSTKTLEIEGDFVVRAGFDLEDPFVITVNESDPALRVTLPPAKILSVELRNVRFLRDEDGFLNKLTAADREEAIRKLRAKVEREAWKSDLPQQARALAEKRLARLLAAEERSVVFEPDRRD